MKVYIKFLVFDFLLLLRCPSLIILCVGKKKEKSLYLHHYYSYYPLYYTVVN